MNFLNADTPLIQCYLRREYLYDLKRGHGDFVPCYVFGVASIQGRAVMFHVLTDSGAQIGRLPISALAHKKDAPPMALDTLELWDAFSYEPSVHKYNYLDGLRCRVFLKDRKTYWGDYKFTIDWCGNEMSEEPGEGGWKCAHIIALDNGNFAAQPNNRIFWHEASFVTRPFKKAPDYKTNSHVWKCEGPDKWTARHSDKFFYDGSDVASK